MEITHLLLMAIVQGAAGLREPSPESQAELDLLTGLLGKVRVAWEPGARRQACDGDVGLEREGCLTGLFVI